MNVTLEMWSNRISFMPAWAKAAAAGAALAAGLGLFWPWSSDLVLEGRCRPEDQEYVPLPMPGNGTIVRCAAGAGDLVEPGATLLTWKNQVPAGAGSGAVQGVSRTSDIYASGNEEEQRIRERYRRQEAEAQEIIRSCQESLNDAYRDPGRNRQAAAASQELARRALMRAQAVPGELRTKMEQEVAVARSNTNFLLRTYQATPPIPGSGDTAEIPLAAEERLLLSRWLVARGTVLRASEPCAMVLPESAGTRVLTVLRARDRSLVRPGMRAVLEGHGYLQDDRVLDLTVESISNRVLDRDEVLALARNPVKGEAYVMLVLRVPGIPQGLVAPTLRCRVKMRSLARNTLARLLS